TIEPSPHRPEKAYFAAYRFLLGDWEPYIYRTDDYGKTWERLTDGSNGIPSDTPTRVIREDPDREGLLYSGTEFGMFISFDDGKRWQSFQLNLPVTPVTDIKVYRKDLVLSTMGRSFWICDDITPLNQLNKQNIDEKFILFIPRDAYRMRYRSFRRSPAEPEYPFPGVNIDYYMYKKPDETVALEIKDLSGRMIRSFSNASGGSRIRVRQGMNRFTWDMRCELRGEDETDNQSRRRRRGPMVVPGKYQTTLTVGDWSQTVQFNILMDPRVAADGVTLADLKAQEHLSLEVLKLLGRARETASRIKKELDLLKPKIKKGGHQAQQAKKTEEKLAEIHAKLVRASGPYPQPKIINQISYLYGMLDRADQKPGRDAYIRYDELNEALNQCLEEIDHTLSR
ncbi:MAG: hypothetical protein PVI11_06480, partial [Candidatus Aminicenantes bacterium]